VVFVVGEILGFTVDRRGGGIDDSVDVVFAGGFQDCLGTVNVVVGDFGGFVDYSEPPDECSSCRETDADCSRPIYQIKIF